MKGRKTLFGAIAGISLLSLCLPLVVAGKAEPSLGSIQFSSPLTVQEALDFARKNKIELTMIQHEFVVDGAKAAGFIPGVPGEGTAEFTTRAEKAHKDFLIDMAGSMPDADASPKMKEALLKRSEAFKKASKLPVELKITNLQGKAEDFSSLQDAGKVKDLQVKKDPPLGSQVLSFLRKSAIGSAIAAVSQESWVPEYGKVAGNSSNAAGERFGQQDFYWDDPNGFGVNDTFEPDLFIYNYDNHSGNHYYNKGQNYQGFPYFTYASSDLPMPYVDSRASDRLNSFNEPEELAYTIGSAYADTIAMNRWYYTYFRTKNGPASSDKVKVQVQRGYRSPSNCYTVWCSFGYESDSTSRYKPFTSWSFVIPGYRSWQL